MLSNLEVPQKCGAFLYICLVMSKRDTLCELGYEDAIVFENPSYEEAIIGTSHDDRVVYSFDKMVECLMKDDGMSYEEAVEFIEYNTIRAIPYFGPNAPIVLMNEEEIAFGEEIDGREEQAPRKAD
jgi:hypothetical protein